MKYYIVRQRSTGYYGELSISANGEVAFANDTTVTLTFSSEPNVLWTPKQKPNIEEMQLIGWYNSDEKTPMLNKNIKPKDIEIIEFEVIK